jgi:hypothetical protein
MKSYSMVEQLLGLEEEEMTIIFEAEQMRLIAEGLADKSQRMVEGTEESLGRPGQMTEEESLLRAEEARKRADCL